MYQFAKWKYWLVILVMVAGIVFFIPNVFGTGPAVQISRNDRQAVTDVDMEKIKGALAAANIPIEAAYQEKDREVVRFATPEQQTQARAAIGALRVDNHSEYLAALSTVPRTPGWMRKTGLKPMSLGLDLRGGVHFVYEVDVDGAVQQALERLDRDGRNTLRAKRIPYGAVTTSNGVVRIPLRNASELDAALDALKSPDGSLTLTTTQGSGGADGENGPVIEIRMTPAEIRRRQDQAVQQNITTLRNRVDELGVSEPVITRQAIKRISVQLPGVDDPNEAIRILSATATVEFHLVDQNNDPRTAEATKRIPIGTKLYQRSREQGGGPILLKREIIASGEQLTDAQSGFQQGTPQVNVKLDSQGGAEMLKTTKENLGKPMAVVYVSKKPLAKDETCEGARSGDLCTEERVISVATIQGVFSSNFQITGLQATEARELALLLRSGALAAPQAIVEQRSVGPTLGEDNIRRGIEAMAIGLLLTFIFMAIYYRGFGWVANAVLAANLILTVGLLSMLQASLSLPGIAAVVFHLGIAVDANILIYERIREELRAGNSPLSAISIGFEKAFATIADSNVTTLIAGVVLFAFGTGTIRSFAIVMTLGILTSLFTSVVGSRALVHAVWGRRRKLDSLPI